MIPPTFAIVLTLSLGHPRDAWFGPDKIRHFVAAAMIESASYAAFRAAGHGWSTSLTGATVVTAGVSVGKEILDRRRTGLFSVRDLTWDAAGAGTAFVVLHKERP